MKKKILGMALIAASFMAFGANAQNNTNCRTVCPEGNAQNCPAPRAGECPASNYGDCRQGKQCDLGCFAGIELTETQKTQLKQLCETRRADRDKQRKAYREEKKRIDNSRREARQADRKAYLEQVKTILGPEKYVQFLENNYMNGNKDKVKAAKRPGRNFKHGVKPGRQGMVFKRDSVKGDRPVRMLKEGKNVKAKTAKVKEAKKK